MPANYCLTHIYYTINYLKYDNTTTIQSEQQKAIRQNNERRNNLCKIYDMAELTSIADHSDWLDNQTMKVEEKWICHRKRVEFGRQPLEKWQFVPCKLVNGVWVVLEEPDFMDGSYDNDGFGEVDKRRYKSELKEYKQAKSLCLFEIYSFESESENFWYFGKDELTLVAVDKTQSVESLVEHKLTLTPAAEKQIGL